MKAPLPNEYAVFYKSYIDGLPEEDILQYLRKQSEEFIGFMKSFRTGDLLHKYQEDKWSVAELFGHIIDVERVMAYRVLRFSRNDKTVLSGFDHDEYVKSANFNDRSLESFIREFEGIRAGNLELIGSFSEEQSTRTGKSGEVIFSVRALVYIIAGHLDHHWTILKERYV